MTPPDFQADIPLTPLGQAAGQRKMAEPTDPFMATAVSLDTPGYDGVAAMGRTFVEEFALMGWSRERIARMFTVPKFVAAHHVYRTRGPEFVEALISEVLGAPQQEVPQQDAPEGEGI